MYEILVFFGHVLRQNAIFWPRQGLENPWILQGILARDYLHKKNWFLRLFAFVELLKVASGVVYIIHLGSFDRDSLFLKVAQPNTSVHPVLVDFSHFVVPHRSRQLNYTLLEE